MVYNYNNYKYGIQLYIITIIMMLMMATLNTPLIFFLDLLFLVSIFAVGLVCYGTN